MKTKKYGVGGDIANTALKSILNVALSPINGVTGNALDPFEEKVFGKIDGLTNTNNKKLLKAQDTAFNVTDGITGALTKVGLTAVTGGAAAPALMATDTIGNVVNTTDTSAMGVGGFKDGGSITEMFTQAYSHGGKLDYPTLEAIGVTKRQANKAYKDFLTKYESGGSLMPFNPDHLEKESENLVQYDGPDHPQGGIKTPSGEFNLQETVLKAGKLSDTPYAFSDINTLDKSTAEQLGLDTKHVGKTMAEISKQIEKKYEVKFNDDDTKAKTKQLMSQDLYSRLMEANETMLMKAKAKQAWDSRPNYGAMSQDEFNDYMCGGKVDKYQGGGEVDWKAFESSIDAMPAGTLESQYRNDLIGIKENSPTAQPRDMVSDVLEENRSQDGSNFKRFDRPQNYSTDPKNLFSLEDMQEVEKYSEIASDPYNYFYDKVFEHLKTEWNRDMTDPIVLATVKANAKGRVNEFNEQYGLNRKETSPAVTIPQAQPAMTPTMQYAQSVVKAQTPPKTIPVTPVGNRTFNNQIKVDPALTQLDFGQAKPITSKKGTPQFINQASINPVNDGLNLNIMTDGLSPKFDPSMLIAANTNSRIPANNSLSPELAESLRQGKNYASTGLTPPKTNGTISPELAESFKQGANYGTTSAVSPTSLQKPYDPLNPKGYLPFGVDITGNNSTTTTPEAKTNPLTSMTNQEKIGLGLKGLAQLSEVASTLGKKQDVAVQRNPYASQVSQLMRDRYVDMTPIQDQIASSARAAYENLAGTNSQVVNAALGQGISNQSMAQMSQAKLQAQQMNNGYKGELASTLNNLGQQSVAAKNYQENLQAQTDASVSNVRREALGNIGNDLGNYFIAKDVVKAKTAEERAFMIQKVKLENMKIQNPSQRKENLASMNELIVRLGGTPIEAEEVGL